MNCSTASRAATTRWLAEEIASLPELIRGYGHIKSKNAADARKKHAELMAQFRRPVIPIALAA